MLIKRYKRELVLQNITNGKVLNQMYNKMFNKSLYMNKCIVDLHVYSLIYVSTILVILKVKTKVISNDLI